MKKTSVAFMLLFFAGATCIAASYQPIEGHIMTRWAREVGPDNAIPEYPRPQMVRDSWLNLNGLWDYAITDQGQIRPSAWQGQILVPYPVESALSGVKKRVGKDRHLWYRRVVSIPKSWGKKRLLLHFGAVDWQATVWVNRVKVGMHQGGYDAFSFDITAALNGASQAEIVMAVWDPTSDGFQPRGKQVNEPRGIWYTAVTGIWQTVWLESVPRISLEKLKLVPNYDESALILSAEITGLNQHLDLVAEVYVGSQCVARTSRKAIEAVRLEIPDKRPWSPEDPFLYDLTVTLKRDGKPIDTVSSYFGMRKLEVKKDRRGLNRIFLNDEPIFLYGPLDQGWWPDGLYTAPTDEALRYDVEVLRAMGMNCLRKHVKVEPLRFYYHCDKLGMIVWQDMPSGDKYIGGGDPDMTRSFESEANFRREWEGIITMLYNSPSVAIWCPFNEGWGQFKTTEILEWTKQIDPTRLVDGPSGWTDRGSGDLHDMHSYPGPGMFEVEASRVSVLGEFGGLGWPVEGHLWWNKRNWGYRNYNSQEDLQTKYIQLVGRLLPLISRGLGAAIYTQTTDVEGEVNGLMTYDRALTKLNIDVVKAHHLKLYQDPPVYRTLVPTSARGGQRWRYVTEKPESDWFANAYDDSTWKQGLGMFGSEGTPNVRVGTPWTTSDIWLRRVVELKEVPETVLLDIYYDEDAEVYINGVLAIELTGYVTTHNPEAISAHAKQALKPGKNLIAVHCHNRQGGQGIDVGLTVETRNGY